MTHVSGKRLGGLILGALVLSWTGCGSSDDEADLPLQPPLATKTFTLDMAPGVSMAFVAIPPGRFWMGGGSGGLKRRRVTVARPYYLGKYEVTQQQWLAVMRYNPSVEGKGPQFPVSHLDWKDCQEFLRRLNQKYGGTTGMTFDLPTEAQWEYACQANSNDADDAESAPVFAWMGSNSGNDPHPVGQKMPNIWGLHDMLGNVCEWCADRVDKRGKSIHDGELHVVRGGCWHDGASECNCRARVERKATVPLRVMDGMRAVCVPK